MSTNNQGLTDEEMLAFLENRPKFSQEELAKYEGKYVAWAPDGKQIVGSADDEEILFNQLKEAGIDTSRVVFSFVWPPEWGSYLG